MSEHESKKRRRLSPLKALAKRKIEGFLLKRGYRLATSDPLPTSLFESLLETYFPRPRECFLIQIGANDGITSDPIHDFVKRHPDQVKGILIEPLKDRFEELRRNYEDCPAIVTVNAAIHNVEKRMTLYRVDAAAEKQLPGWAKGIASFDSRHHELSSTARKHILGEEVACVSLDELLDRYQVENVDVLVTDTEGYDYEILRHLNFDRLRPRLIHFEHGLPHGIMDWTQLSFILRRLHENGYSCFLEYYDAIAFQGTPALSE